MGDELGPCPIRRYQDYMDSLFTKLQMKLPASEESELRSKAKGKLESENWNFAWISKKDKKMKTGVRDEIRYISPDNKIYISLNMACKAYLEAQKSGPGPKRRVRKGFESVLDQPSMKKKRGRPAKKAREGLQVSETETSLQMEIEESPHKRVKRDRFNCETDYICSVCMEGGTLMICDQCPSTFHPPCVGLEEIPEGGWSCSSCSCIVCGSSEYYHGDQLTDKNVLHCHQCEQKYHAGCLQTNDWMTLYQMGFCSTKCSKIFHRLRELVGICKPTSVKGVHYTILRSSRENNGGLQNFDTETISKHHAKLNGAKRLLQLCFHPITEPRTKRDLVGDVLYNRENELDRLNFRGFYTMLLQKGDRIVTVATFRVFGDKLAEMPFIGTHPKYRFQGMCHLLVDELSKLLSELGVERLILPATNETVDKWLTKFKFTAMTWSDLLELSRYRFITFAGLHMCQKVLRGSTTSHDPDVQLFSKSVSPMQQWD